jgi:hypothetical protein
MGDLHCSFVIYPLNLVPDLKTARRIGYCGQMQHRIRPGEQ